VGYIRIKNFQGNTYDDLNAHLEKLKIENNGQLKGLVLDLRNNPGGLLDQAILISDRFIDEGALVITVGEGNRTRDVKRAHFAGTESEYPIAILVNGGSASASEIVAGAIKNQNRGIVIGQQTFGKGSVQVLYDFKDNSALKLTIAQYLTPGDVSIQSVGIHPDVELVPVTAEKDAVHIFAHDDAPREKDLDMHLEQSKSRIKSDGTTVAQILHLLEPDPEVDAEEAKYATDDMDLENDFEVQLARELLAKSTKRNRDDLLGESAALFAARKSAQKQKIQERLEGFGLDWSPGPTLKANETTFDIDFSAKGEGKTALIAGDTIGLEATVRNTGTKPLHQLKGVTESDNPYLDKLEFVFGKVMPGESAMWSSDIKLPAAITPRGDRVVLHVGNDEDWRVGKRAELLVDIQELSKPHFSYRVQIDDRQGGNGDGLLQVGEAVDCIVSVGNEGRGAARDAVVSAKNMSGTALFLEVGRNSIGELPVGGRAIAPLKFEVKSAPEDGYIELRLSIWDGELGASLSNVLKLPVVVQRTSKRNVQVVKMVGEAPIPVRVATADDAEILGYLKPGDLARSEVTFQQAWRRLKFGKDTFGFVPFEKAKPSKGKPSKKSLGLAALQSAPIIFMDIPSLQVETPSLDITAKLADNDALKDVYIFVNDHKVHYESLVDSRRLDEQVVAQLSVSLPLEAGDNTVSVIVRETDTLVSRKVFTIYRTAKDTMANRDVENGSRRHQ
jgi:carboxyl-terminal processing protease